MNDSGSDAAVSPLMKPVEGYNRNTCLILIVDNKNTWWHTHKYNYTHTCVTNYTVHNYNYSVHTHVLCTMYVRLCTQKSTLLTLQLRSLAKRENVGVHVTWDVGRDF